MAEETQDPPKPRGSCLGKLVSLITFAGIAGLGVALWFIAQPQDLSDIKGTSAPAGSAKARDINQVLTNAVEQSFKVTLTEEEINQYIKQTLVPKQGGLLGEWVKLEDVRVRLEKDRAEVIMVRSVMGQKLTLSMYCRIEQTVGVNDSEDKRAILDGGTFLEQMPDSPLAQRLRKGGRFGKLVMPQGFYHLALPSFKKLAAVYEPELDKALDQMSRITIEKGKLVLDPNPGGGSALPPSGKF